jgi:hypothetical protein
VANKEVEQQFLGGHDIAIIGNRKNLWKNRKNYSLNVNILGKAAMLHFALTSFLWLGLCQLSLQIIGYSCAYVKFS